MTGRIEEVLELIDGALGDYELSGDAMRWTPSLAEAATGEVDVDEADGLAAWR